MMSKQQKTILIIEAHRALQVLYAAELQEEGFKVLIASNADEAQQLFNQNNVNLLMSDLRERRPSGISSLIGLARERAIPLVINTGYPLNMIDRSAISGAAWIQEKSSDLDKLKEKIGELLGNGCPVFQHSAENNVLNRREGVFEQSI